ncbi:hypothetical protein BXO88_09890 [Oribacterium sp. C9]|uniref:putative phage tail protein n=1 Tax=Oribacterium sp. C9 TaxID=1943579 RepID=UPI00098FBDB2|nr:putative phage tail protein [Oribacterium sp. C9]OON85927.1 hypothetical protein BXO88_09890 [Oribacterium sp. C9]
MIREVDLNSYLPPYLKGYKEIAEALKAEDPEFGLLWEQVDRLLKNQFIEDADEYGISRREEILGILPSNLDTLESRRSRVQTLWWNPTPYSIRAFTAKIADLCSENGYEIDKSKLQEYWLGLTTHLSKYGQLDNLRQLVVGMPPCNMVVDVINEIVTQICAAVVYAGTVLTVGSVQHLDNDIHSDDELYINPKALVAAVGEIYEDCEGNFARAEHEDLTTKEQCVGTGITCGMATTLSM